MAEEKRRRPQSAHQRIVADREADPAYQAAKNFEDRSRHRAPDKDQNIASSQRRQNDTAEAVARDLAGIEVDEYPAPDGAALEAGEGGSTLAARAQAEFAEQNVQRAAGSPFATGIGQPVRQTPESFYSSVQAGIAEPDQKFAPEAAAPTTFTPMSPFRAGTASPISPVDLGPPEGDKDGGKGGKK